MNRGMQCRAYGRSILVVGLTLALAVKLTSLADEKSTQPAPAQDSVSDAPSLPKIALLDLTGVAHRLESNSARGAVAFVFLSTECPIANGTIPELNRIAKSAKNGSPAAELFGIISDPAISRKAATKHSEEFKLEFPVLFDASGELAAALKPTHTPEAFVFDLAGKLIYRGRINDAYAGLGKQRLKVTSHDLADALDAARSGNPVQAPRTEPVGCLFEANRSGKSDHSAPVTYTRDIAPLLQAHCVACHRDGEVAPFPLTSYEHASKRAAQLVTVTQSRFMPPWRPEPEFGHFVGERRLTDRELKLFENWATSGTREGDPADLPPPARFTEGWQLGEPDLIVKMPEPFTIPAEGRDVFRNFVIPLPVTKDELVAAVEFRPGNRRVVHHTIYYLDSNGAARKKDEADPGPGYSSFGGPGIVPTGAIGGWAPGGNPQRLPDNMGRLLRKGSDLVLQIHYHPTGKEEVDQSTLGIHFVKSSSSRVVAGIMVIDRNLYIPAAEERHPMSGSYTLPADVTMVGITPHMHLLGREMKATATFPDGKVEPLIWVKDWNFNWQDQYHFARPFKLPKGTRLDVQAVYDNSSKNPLNPNSPPKNVKWGEQTNDEMFICFFLVSTDKPQDLIPLVVHNLTSAGRKKD